MIAFIEEHREVYGVEPVHRQLPIASSTYYARAAVARDPGLASDRAKRDAKDLESIRRATTGAAAATERARSGASAAPRSKAALVHHSDRGGQYLSMRYLARLAEAGIDTSVGSVGDSCDNALAETVIGLFKTEVADHLGRWETVGKLEWETLGWVH